MTSRKRPARAGDTIVALDLGTSSVRALLFDRRGQPVPGAESQRPYQQRTTADGGVEADAEMLANLTIAAARELLKGLSPEVRQSIRGVAASCFWHSLMGVDGDGQPATPLFSWADTRAGSAALALREELDPSEYHVRTGCELHPCFWPAKLRWLRESEPEAYRKVKRWIGFGEYLMLRLFGRPVASISMASGTGLYDPNDCAWDEHLLDRFGIPADRLPEIAEDGAPLTGMLPEHRRALGVLADVPWYAAYGDGACSNIGGGGTDETAIAFNIGTSAAMRITVEAERTEIVPGLFCYRVDRRRLLCGGAFATGGNIHAWLARTLQIGDAEARALAKIPPASHGLTVLPFWAGERSPGWHPQARAAILGMNLHTTPQEILCASLESAGYLYDIVRRRLTQRFPQAQTVVATGGALNHNPAWTQILTDIFGAPIQTAPVFEASSRGAALLALEALGLIDSPARLPLGKRKVYRPDPDRHQAHRDAAARFEEMYGTITDQPS